ncbi:hypothetical protein T492DRAFT_1148001 [Pavlovales sp. CCMP2436]|nr:hypothetical protein T492DRAFT_1148001 [Pavlovales sp. CCMP2436]
MGNVVGLQRVQPDYERHHDEFEERVRRVSSSVRDVRSDVTKQPLRRLPSDRATLGLDQWHTDTHTRATLATLRHSLGGHLRAVIIDGTGGVEQSIIPRRRLCREMRIAQRDLRALDPDLSLGTEALTVLVRSHTHTVTDRQTDTHADTHTHTHKHTHKVTKIQTHKGLDGLSLSPLDLSGRVVFSMSDPSLSITAHPSTAA